jgi:hypothetical protein
MKRLIGGIRYERIVGRQAFPSILGLFTNTQHRGTKDTENSTEGRG